MLRSNFYQVAINRSGGKSERYIEFENARYKLADESRIPTDNPELPSFESDCLREHKEDLEIIEDFFIGSKRWVSCSGIKDRDRANRYLPRWHSEPEEDYLERVKRTPFHNFFKPALTGYPGFLSDIRDIDKLYSGIVENQNDIDLQGNNLVSFLWQADLKAIRDGFCGVLVDMPRIPRDENGNKIIRTKADEINFKSRPYLTIIERKNILSCDYEIINGRLQIDRITIREYVDKPVGRFGTQTICHYKTFWADGGFNTQVFIEIDGEAVPLELEDGYSDLKEVPIVLYSSTEICPLNSEPPLLNLVEKNRAFYELYSEYRTIIHKMNTPVPVRVGLIQYGSSNQDLPPMIFGGGYGIDVPTGGDFKFVEPGGNALATDKAELNSLEIAMHQDSLKFISSGSADRTATESLLDATQVRATLFGMANLKENNIQEIAAKWAGYYGKRDEGGTCTVNKDLLQMPLTEGEINALARLAAQNQISTITLLEMLRDGKRLPSGLTPAKEVKRLEAQFRLRLKQQQEQMLLMQSGSTLESNRESNEN